MMNVVIIGAGVAGLTLAHRLCKAGVHVVLVERENAVGGLARSLSYSNGATFDTGPHRFRTEDSKVLAFVQGILKDNYLWTNRNSKLFLFNRYLPWPLTLKSIFALPPRPLLRASLDLLLRQKARTDSFEDYIIEKYGATLYRVFFQPYTEKFLHYRCGEVHRDWAVSGISRATVDSQIDTTSLRALARSLLSPSPPQARFLYPQQGGIGAFADTLAAQLQKNGTQILLSETVAHFKEEGGRISAVRTTSGIEIPADFVFWSGSLVDLRRIGGAEESVPRLRYLSTILFNYTLNRPCPQSFQWCYFGGKDMKLDRVYLPREFNPALVPQGKDTLGVELACYEDSDTWRDPGHLDRVVETFLLKARLLDSLDCIEECKVERLRETYPLYLLNYPQQLGAFLEWVHGKWRNLTPLGRTGRFWYNNMDHSIAASLAVAERFLSDVARGAVQTGEAYAADDRHLTGRVQ